MTVQFYVPNYRKGLTDGFSLRFMAMMAAWMWNELCVVAVVCGGADKTTLNN